MPPNLDKHHGNDFRCILSLFLLLIPPTNHQCTRLDIRNILNTHQLYVGIVVRAFQTIQFFHCIVPKGVDIDLGVKLFQKMVIWIDSAKAKQCFLFFSNIDDFFISFFWKVENINFK